MGEKDWQVRLDRLSESLWGADVDWFPWNWIVMIRIRRGARMPPELVEEMKSCRDIGEE